ncbi:MAG: hypothetical protein WD294_16500 [Phycisphaeraceae bacterium]
MRTFLGIIAGVFITLFLLTGLLGAGAYWFIGSMGLGEFEEVPDYIEYTLTGPDEAEVGEAVTFTIEVTNTSPDTEHTIYSVDIYSELADQGDVTSAPEPVSTDPSFGYTELRYDTPLPPGATETIEVTLNPTAVGEHNVNIDVCIDGPFSIIERFHDLRLREAAVPAAAESSDE